MPGNSADNAADHAADEAADNAADEAADNSAGRAPRKALKQTKKRQGAGRKPGRPYRRLADDVLGVRKTALEKKVEVLVARRTLLEDRLKAYESEVATRAEEAKHQEDAQQDA